MGRAERQDHRKFLACNNRQIEVLRDPKVVDRLAVNEYVAGLVCNRTVETEQPVVIRTHPDRNLGEYDDRRTDRIGRSEGYFIGTLLLGNKFSEVVGCHDCPYTKSQPTSDTLAVAATIPQVLNQLLANPDPNIAAPETSLK